MSSWGSQLPLVLWKHVYLTRIRRHYVATLLQVAFMVLLLNGVWEESVAPYSAAPSKEQFYDVSDPLEPWRRKNFTHGLFAFTPPTGIALNISGKAAPILGSWTLMPMENTSALQDFVAQEGEDRVGIAFKEEPDGISYVVRFKDTEFDIGLDYGEDLLTPGPRSVDNSHEITRLLPVQYAVESSIIQLTAPRESNYSDNHNMLELQRFPYPRVFEGSEGATLSMVAIRFGIGIFVPFCTLVMTLVQEKSTGMKGMLWRTGIIEGVYWMGHFLDAGLVIITAVSLMYGPLFVLPNSSGTTFLQYTNPAIMLLILLLFGALTILHGMFLSVFIWRRAQLSWTELFDEETTLDNVSIGSLTMIALVTAVVLGFLIWYLDNIVPWNYTVSKPFYFFLTFDYWTPYRKWNIRREQMKLDAETFEPEPTKMDPAVVFVDTNKTGTKGISSPVYNVNLNIYSKQTTVLLGPEKCGHITLINFLTGADVPTTGEVYINNYDVVSNPRKAWEFLSYCPRDNIVFADMTVEEHILYFTSIRGTSWRDAHDGAMAVLRQLDLFNVKDELVGTLTVRMQRSVCVAIAVCLMDKIPVLILEEPTRLMDPKCRHEVWEMIMRASRRSSVLMTTNSMEEAENMADRVIMMHEGKVVCAGSPGWLRERFGSKYYMHFTKATQFRSNYVERLIWQYVGKPTKISDTTYEAVYYIGERSRTSRMAALFRALDLDRTRLGFVFMGVAVTSLEDIYLKIAAGEDPKKAGAGDAPEAQAKKEAEDLEALHVVASAKAGPVNVCAFLVGLLMKRFVIWRRVWSTRTLELWLPLGLFLLSGFLEARLSHKNNGSQQKLTYTVQTLFRQSYGFVVSDKPDSRFVKNVIVPLMQDNNVHLLPIEGHSVEKELLALAQEDIYRYVYWYHYGVTILGDKVRLWYNAQCPHTAILITNMYHTAVYRNLSTKQNWHITLTNYPFEDVKDQAEDSFRMQHGSIVSDHEENLFVARNGLLRVVHSLVISLAMSFHSASYIFLPVLERVNGVKHLQLMTGMPGYIFWAGNLLFDGFFAVVHGGIFTAAIFWNHSYITSPYVGSIFALFCAYAMAVLPLTYLCSMMFTNAAWAFSILALLLFLAGMVGSLAVEMFGILLRHAPSDATSILIVLWGFFCRWFPTYSLTRGVIKIILLYKFNVLCTTGGDVLIEACSDHYLSNDGRITPCCNALKNNETAGATLTPLGMGYETGLFELVTMLVEGLLYMGLLSLMDSPQMSALQWYWYGRNETQGSADQDKGPRLVAVALDHDVEKEAELVEEIYKAHVFKNVALAVRGLEKWIGHINRIKTVGSLSFTLKQDECLGLIGVNLSGKTTIMNILTGLVVPTSGNAYMPKLSLRGDLKQWQQCIGYAPESTFLIPCMTGREVLDLFARFKGISDRSHVVTNVLKFVSITQQNTMWSKYSIGEQKILGIAIALLGVPPILLLDEPISDVDPVSRIQIMRILQVLKSSRTMSIIISSHGIRHCEHLCDRVALLVGGKIEAMGNALQLNEKYGRCYTITIKTLAAQRNDIYYHNRICRAMKEEFHQCALSHNYKGILCFRVGKTYNDWNEIFYKMVDIQQKLEFKDFLISDITLEHIFVGLARKQILATANRVYLSTSQ
ncbi:phospholipid-transporting ATPase ABCA3-like isoform X2 [Ornithodoros turicata]|uniref:phospholipid-transporting ATPase ABCA3-like isoform X2 n=1 Tax=Ornithodoros turicata TaxID=34597 RepID=UPI0031393001